MNENKLVDDNKMIGRFLVAWVVIGFVSIVFHHGEEMVGLLFIIMMGYFYILPSLVARRRRHPRIIAICALNFFLGWTVIGWLVARAWALKHPVAEAK